MSEEIISETPPEDNAGIPTEADAGTAFVGITEFIIGTPGQKPRFFLSATRENALKQVREGEVCFSQVNYPPRNHKINAEGTALIDDPIPVEKVIATGWAEIKMQREEILNLNRWAWMPDSPLTEANQADWMAWAKKLHRLTLDFPLPQDVVWPAMPDLIYPDDPA